MMVILAAPIMGQINPFSAYSAEAMAAWAEKLAAATRSGVDAWGIFDNTASGAALGNALAFERMLAPYESEITGTVLADSMAWK